MTNYNKAVILGCNYYIGLSAIRCLGIHGIPTVAVDYTDKGTYGARSKYCSERLIAPHYKEDKEAFVRFLIDYAAEQSQPPVLIPCHDSYVEIIDEHLEELRAYYLIPQTEQGLYTRIMNKESLHRIASEFGVLVPETVRPSEDFLLDKVRNILGYPCIVKPTDSPSFVARFRRKLFTIHNEEELLRALNDAQTAGLDVIIQRIIPGFDDHMHTFDAYLDQSSKVTHWVTCQKLRQYPINFGASVYTMQKHVPELYDIGAAFLERVKWKGFAEIEFKKDAETGQYYLIEVNVRFSNLNVLLQRVGVNMPYITYSELTGSTTVEPKAVTENKNRVFWYAYEDLLALRDYVRTKQLTVGQAIRSLFKRKAYAIWDWSDPMPGFAYLSMLTGKLRARRKR
jgi:predicted ATP-grasp superfamily ATP-dependent carboligase